MKKLFLFLLLLIPLGLVAQSNADKPEFLYGTDLIDENVAVFRITAPGHDPYGIYVIQIDPKGKILELRVDDVRKTFEEDARVIAAVSAPEGGYQKINGRIMTKTNPDYDIFMAWEPYTPAAFFSESYFPSYREYDNIMQGQALIVNKRVVTKDNYTKGPISAVGIDRYENLTFLHTLKETTPFEFAGTVLDAMPRTRVLMMTTIGPNASIGFISGSQYYYSIGNTTYVNTSLFTIR